MKPQPMIAVADVEATSRWYQSVLGLTSAHGGSEYEMLCWDGAFVLQLHHREFWLRDPNGYTIVVASPFGDMGD